MSSAIMKMMFGLALSGVLVHPKNSRDRMIAVVTAKGVDGREMFMGIGVERCFTIDLYGMRLQGGPPG